MTALYKLANTISSVPSPVRSPLCTFVINPSASVRTVSKAPLPSLRAMTQPLAKGIAGGYRIPNGEQVEIAVVIQVHQEARAP